jgi:hypothetical protein
LAPTICHVGSSTFRLLVPVEVFIELGGFVEPKKFVEPREFKETVERVRLCFGASEYLADLFL